MSDHDEFNHAIEALHDLSIERDALRARVAELERECAQMSEEFGLPPTMRPIEGEIRRFMTELKESHARASAAEQRAKRMEGALCEAERWIVEHDGEAEDCECSYCSMLTRIRAALAASETEVSHG